MQRRGSVLVVMPPTPAAAPEKPDKPDHDDEYAEEENPETAAPKGMWNAMHSESDAADCAILPPEPRALKKVLGTLRC